MNELRGCQNRAIKAIFQLPYYYPTNKLYKDNRVLNIRSIIQIQTITMVHKTRQNTIRTNKNKKKGRNI